MRIRREAKKRVYTQNAVCLQTLGPY